MLDKKLQFYTNIVLVITACKCTPLDPLDSFKVVFSNVSEDMFICKEGPDT